jgi:outer membrane protein W
MMRTGIARTVRMATTMALAAGLWAAPPARAEMLNAAAWNTGAQWLSVRFGYAKAQGHFTPNGGVGYGFGYSRMVSKRLSMGMSFEHDLLGKFAGSALIEMPLAVEALWHFHMRSAFVPYTGMGIGGAYRKTYRTGADESSIQPLYFGSLGVNVPVGIHHVFGLDTRLAGVSSDREGSDPVFGFEKARSVHWGVKVNYALTY